MVKKSDTDGDILKLLNSRSNIAKAFSKDWVDSVKKWMKDYEIESLDEINFTDLHNKIQIPYIFSTIESGLPAMFERMPNIIMKQRGKLDRDFTVFADQVWSYVSERMKLEDKIEDLGMSFMITGMGFAKWGWNLETEEIDGEPEIVEITNDDGTVIGQEQIAQKIQVAIKDDPFLRIFYHDEITFSPDSKFVTDDNENEIPYIICKTKMSPEEIEAIYKVKIPDADKLDLDMSQYEDSIKNNILDKNDIKRANVYEYYGILPKQYANDPSWRFSKNYYVVFSKNKILKKPEEKDKKPTLILGNYGLPNKFFKFGEPKVLRELEQDVSLGRSRMMDIRDKHGTKIALSSTTEVDIASLKRPADFTILKFNGPNPPQYLTPPPISESIMMALQQSRQDIQMASAQLDLSRGGSQSVVNTATGQSIFAEATQKRNARKKKKITKFIKAIAVNILTLCAQNWDIEKFSKIVDMAPEEIEQRGFIEKLGNIGEDYDIVIEIESISTNKETVAAQAIALYREVKEDPLINRDEVLKEVLKIGFNVSDFDRFLSSEVSPEQIMKMLEYMVQNQILDLESASMLAQKVGTMNQQGSTPNQGGRPATQDPTSVVKNSMPAANQTQLTAQTQAAGQQANQPR